MVTCQRFCVRIVTKSNSAKKHNCQNSRQMYVTQPSLFGCQYSRRLPIDNLVFGLIPYAIYITGNFQEKFEKGLFSTVREIAITRSVDELNKDHERMTIRNKLLTEAIFL